MAESSPVLAGFAVGVALAGAPGPVQAVLLAESVRGGVGRGFRALAGSSLTFAALLAVLALGVTVAQPRGVALRGLRIAGGMLLLWLAYDGVRARVGADDEPVRRELPPVARGSLAILVNPGAWLFLAAVGSPLIAGATRASGTGSAFLAAASLLAGAALGDCAVVLLGGLGVRRAGSRAVAIVRRALALLLAGLGVWLVVKGLT